MRFCKYFPFLLIFTLSCNLASEPPSEGGQIKSGWCSTPGNTLRDLAWVWSHHTDIDSYKRLLTNDYHFYFDPNDVGTVIPGSGYIIPAVWDRATDILATENMFNQAYDLSLEILNADDFDQDYPGTVFTANNVAVQFYIWPDNPNSSYLATGPCDFEFEKVGNLWLIKSWYDRTGGPGSIGTLREQYLQ